MIVNKITRLKFRNRIVTNQEIIIVYLKTDVNSVMTLKTRKLLKR